MPRRKAIPAAIRERVRAAAKNRCGYCLAPQKLVLARLQIEHIRPLAHGGTDDEQNLWLACPICNAHKADKINGVDPTTGKAVPLFNPRLMTWHEHFEWSADGLQIIGKTTIGRATVVALRLSDDADVLLVRQYWVAAGWHPPGE
jgi:hypothetical protein